MIAILKRALPAIALLCAVCYGNPPIFFGPGEVLEVAVVPHAGEAKRFSLQPADNRYAQLQTWLGENQSGWFPYMATTPGFGVFVSGDHLRLQFLDSTVLACRMKEACLQKSTHESQYEFLVK